MIGLQPRVRLALQLGVLAMLLWLGGCRTLGYYGQAIHGHVALMSQRQSIQTLIDDAGTQPALRARLSEALSARRFASDRLQLPRNGSYTRYVALDRSYVTWAVVAAPEFSLDPVQHCFPFAGCVAYRGYFSQDQARREASRLRARGYETYINGVVAYSTLGWFDDPVLSSMWNGGDPVGIVFHELAHQRLYLPGDTDFSESYASFVEQEGLREWRAAHGLRADESAHRREAETIERVFALRRQLAAIYAQPLAPAAMREAKRQAIEAFRTESQRLRERWRAEGVRTASSPDDWAEGAINNARLAAVAAYDRWVPAFAALFRRAGGDWTAFHTGVEHLSKQPKADRDAELAAIGDVRPR